MRTILVLLVLTGAAWPRSSPIYDLDSLIWQSEHVVEVEYLGDRRARVVQSFLGEIGIGTRLACPAYRLFAAGADWQRIPLEPGAHMFLFLDQRKRAVVSGAWLVHAGRVQRPFNYRMGSLAWADDQRAPRVTTFRRGLPDRIRGALALRDRLNRPADARDVPVLLELLRARCARPALPDDDDLRRYDLVTRKMCRILAGIRDHDALAAALRLTPGWRARITLGEAFGTPKGRDELLRRIADASAPLDARLGLVPAIGDAGIRYRSTQTFVDGEWHYHRRVDKGNDGYLTRIAALARSSAMHAELCAALCTEIRQGIGTHAEVRVDLRATIPILAALHHASKSERVRFEVARTLTSIDGSAYDALGSPSGAALGRLTRHGRAGFRFSYYSRCAFDKSVIVFERDGRQTEVEVSIPLLRGKGGFVSSGLSVRIPAKLVAGRYRAWIRLYLDGDIKSDGYGCTVELPARD